jgi:ferredoxin-NADP reductase
MRVIGAFTTPLLPDDYLGLVNPLWSTRELRGRVRRIDREAAGAVTITIKPGWEWPGHRAGQYLRVGVSVDGRHHWRAYSLTSDPGRGDGCITITPKLVEGGTVSPFLCRRLRPGDVLRLGGVEGAFVLPDPLPRRLLMVSAGSGVTPLFAMLRQLDRAGALLDVVHVHCARTAEQVIFGERLRALAARNHGYRLHERHTAIAGRLSAGDLDALCPDWAGREAFACGPPGLLAALRERWHSDGRPDRLHVEQFVPDGPAVGSGPRGCGGAIDFVRSGVRACSDGTQPMLAAGEDAGAKLPYGCRMGICHSCVGRLRSGRVRDLRTGEVLGQPGETVRTCINAPEGDVEIDL